VIEGQGRHGPAASVGVVALETEVQSVVGGPEGGDDVAGAAAAGAAQDGDIEVPEAGGAGGPREQVEGGGAARARAGRVDEVVEGAVVQRRARDRDAEKG